MPLQYDSIPLERMSPDSSAYEKGVRLVTNLAPWDGGAWSTIRQTEVNAQLAVGAGEIIGTYTDPGGSCYVGYRYVTGSISSIFLYDPAAPSITNVSLGGATFPGKPAAWRFTRFGGAVIAAPENVGVGTALELQSRTGGNFGTFVSSADRPAPKFIGTCKSHLIGAYNLAFGGAGVYTSVNTRQLMWSSRNNAAVWTPGTDRAGFAPDLNSNLGDITGLMCFEEFFVVFQQFGATRFSWVGGAEVWQAQEIAGPAFGFNNPVWTGGFIRADRDVYYPSNVGLAVIRNGEAPYQIGAGVTSRFFREGTEYPINRAFPMDGEYHDRAGLLIWTASNGVGFFQILYHPASERFSILTEESLCRGLCIARQQTETVPLGSVVFFELNPSNILEARRPTTANTSPASFYLKRWRPATGLRAALHAVRDLVLLPAGATYPTFELSIQPALDPRFPASGPAASVFTSASRDGNGWWTDSRFPLEGNEFVGTLTIPSAAGLVIQEIPAIELAFQAKSIF